MKVNQLYFCHVPQTMGTTLKSIFLAPYFKREESMFDLQWRPALYNSIGDIKKFKLLCGHLPFNIKSVLGYQPPTITIMRDPLQRSLSMYKFIQKVERHYLHDITKRMSLLEFAQDPETRYIITNMQARYIGYDAYWGNLIKASNDPEKAGVLDREFEFSKPYTGEKLLQKAKDHVDQCLWVGLSEQFYDSIHLLYRLLGVDPIPVTEGLRSHEHALSSKEQEILAKMNRIDLLLYAYVEDKLEEKLNEFEV